MKKLIIAEKPSVAADLAKALGGSSAGIKKKGEYYEGDQIVISSAVGHLVELYMPDDIEPKLKYWKMDTLPIVPETFQLKVIAKTKRKFNELKTLLRRKDVDEVYNACDAGREGELIFTYIYELAGCNKPVKRMWMLSMTQSAIRSAFENPRIGDDMLRLQNAARCRSEADWLIGINGTRAITLKMGGLRKMTTVGRVQTPTLTLVVNREKEIQNFEPRKFNRLLTTFKIESGNYVGTYQRPNFKKDPDNKHDRIDRIWNPADVESILASLQNGAEAKVEETQKRTPQASPRLYDLTTLQREANNRFGMSANRTLQVAQALYEKHKVITYPRTDSRALPEDYGSTCIEILKSIGGELQPHAEKVLENGWVATGNKKIFNNKQISDHFAIVPTNQPKDLSGDDLKIYGMIVRRFIATFYPPAQFDVTTRLTRLEEHTFKTEGKVLVEPSWLSVYGKDSASKENLVPLSPADGDPPSAILLSNERTEEATKPPPRYTEATLLAAMEGAGRLVEDEDMAQAMKEKGLGTPATRAATIEHLLKEEYIKREGRDIHPREKAEDLIEFLDAVEVEGLTSPDMTGEWEHKLLQMEQGELSRQDFMDGIVGFTKTIVDRASKYEESGKFLKQTDVNSPTDGQHLQESLTHYISQDGKLRINKTMGNRRITLDEISEIFEKGSAGPFDGFLSKAKKPFSAFLRFDSTDNRVKFDFERDTPQREGQSEGNEPEEDPRGGEKIGVCPCKETIYETSKAYICADCSCDPPSPFKRFSRNVLGKAIPKEQFLKLLSGEKTDLIEGFRSKKSGRYFSARLAISNNKLSFEFESKRPKKASTKKE